MTAKIMPLRERDTSTVQAAADAFLSPPGWSAMAFSKAPSGSQATFLKQPQPMYVEGGRSVVDKRE
jgi:hypothetical protein